MQTILGHIRYATWTDLSAASCHEAQKQSTALNESRSLIELREICATEGKWGKLSGQTRGLIASGRNVS